MIIYFPEPTMFLSNTDTQNTIILPLPSGGHMVAELCADNRLKIISISSTDPMDYMNSYYQPGSYVNMQPKLE